MHKVIHGNKLLLDKLNYFCIMHKHIASTQNTRVKYILQLQEKSRVRKKEDTFVIEGKREISLAIESGVQLIELFYCPDLIPVSEIECLEPVSTVMSSVSKEVYKKIAYRAGTEGVIALAKNKILTLQELKLPGNPLILIAEAPEKPGNIGALMRTADAAGVDAFIIANPRTDLYNPNIIRSSVGCVFTNTIVQASNETIISFLKEQDIAIYSAILQTSEPYHIQDYKRPTAIVVGTEAKGLSEIWRDVSTKNIRIPMLGVIDSMNVSVAAGILVFEAKRQRGF